MSTYAYCCTLCSFKVDLEFHNSVPFTLQAESSDVGESGASTCADTHIMRRDWQGGGNGVIVR